MTSPLFRRIFLDANVPAYAGGSPHQLRDPCITVLELALERPRAFWSDAEVLQELLHRYHAINRWTQGKLVFDGFAGLMAGRVEPILARDVEAAAELADRWPRLSARDLLHLAVMARVGCDTLVSADRGFDQATQVTRLDPADVVHWRAQVGT